MHFRHYRKMMGWSLEDAAKLLGLKDGSTVAKHELGRCMPSVDVLARYEELTDRAVKADDFIASRRAYKSNPEQARKMLRTRRIAQVVP